MKSANKPVIILLADDDIDDCLIIRDAFEESHVADEVRTVQDGQELLDYLRQTGRFSAPNIAPKPSLILLDLNMPRKKGFEAIREIKADATLRKIPIVVLSTSSSDADIALAYDLGASSFITKPVTFDSMVDITRTLGCYWFKMVKLPETCCSVHERTCQNPAGQDIAHD